MLVFKNNLSRYHSTGLSFTFLIGLTVGISSEASADRSNPKCRDVRSATAAVNRATASVARYQANLVRDKKWMDAAKAMCTNPTATPTPSPVACKTSQIPKAPVWENGVCMHYTETYFTCEKDFNSFNTGGAQVTFRGKSGNQWQINYRAPGNFPPCPAQ